MKKSIGSKIWEIFEKFVLFCLRLILKPFKKTLTPEQEQAFMQFVKFGIVGLSNTALAYAITVGSLFLYQRAGYKE